MSSSHGFWSLGGFLGGALGGRAIEVFSAEAQAIGVAVLSLMIVRPASRFLLKDAPHPAVLGEKPRAVLFPKVPVLYLLGAMALFSMVPEGAVLDWAALYVHQEPGAGLGPAGLAFGFFSGAMALMRFAGDGVRDRFGAMATLRISDLIGATGLIVAAFAQSDMMAIAGFCFAGLGVANMVPIMFSAAGNYPGVSPGAGIATITMLGYCGILVAPSGVGIIAQQAGFRFTYAVLAVLLVVVASLAGKAKAADGVARAAVDLPLDGGIQRTSLALQRSSRGDDRPSGREERLALEQVLLAGRARRLKPKVTPGFLAQHPSARGAQDQALLQQERLYHFLDRIARL